MKLKWSRIADSSRHGQYTAFKDTVITIPLFREASEHEFRMAERECCCWPEVWEWLLEYFYLGRALSGYFTVGCPDHKPVPLRRATSWLRAGSDSNLGVKVDAPTAGATLWVPPPPTLFFCLKTVILPISFLIRPLFSRATSFWNWSFFR